MTQKAIVTTNPYRLHELNINGLFHHPHWMVFLLSGLAERQISVVAGHAAQQISHGWDATFQLDFGKSSSTAESIDYLALAGQRTAHASATPPKLTTFHMNRRPDNSLEIIVHGPDQIGFLGKLLGEVALLALYPIEMEISTLARQIKDRIVLRGIGGSAPSDNIESSLRALLQSFVT